MKKNNILLFIMSVISFVIAGLGILGSVIAIVLGNSLAGSMDKDELTRVLGVFAYIGIFALLIFAVFIAVTAAVPGILGLICSLKNGKFAIGCIIIGGVGSFRSLIWLIDSIIQETSVFIPIAVFLYFGLYTTGAAMIYIYQ